MPERSDYATGDRTKVGAYVDDGIYSAFREWVEAQAGRQYAEVGQALERAMLEYMTDDRIQDQLDDIDTQTQLNEALLRQVIDRLETVEPEKEKGNSNSVPKGKSPGDRKHRERAVIRALLMMNNHKFRENTIKEAIRDVAGVSSDKTVRGYLEAITSSKAFVSTKRVGQWHLDRDAAIEILRENDMDIPEGIRA